MLFYFFESIFDAVLFFVLCSVAESDVDSTDDIRYYAVVSVRKSKSSTVAGSFNLSKSHSQVAYSGRSRPATSKGDEKSSGLCYIPYFRDPPITPRLSNG